MRSNASISAARLAASLGLVALAALFVAALLAGLRVGEAHSAVQQSHGEVICGGTLGAISVDSVLVPSGSTCILDGTQVRGNALAAPDSELHLIPNARVGGNVEAKAGARTSAVHAEIAGNFTCERCSFHQLFQADVGGNVELVGVVGTAAVGESRIGGNIEVVDSTAPPPGAFGTFFVGANIVGGSVRFVKHRGSRVFSLFNTIAGDLQVAESRVEAFFGNRVDGNMQLVKNTFPSPLIENTVGAALECAENQPAPTGSGNVAEKKEGQCAGL